MAPVVEIPEVVEVFLVDGKEGGGGGDGEGLGAVPEVEVDDCAFGGPSNDVLGPRSNGMSGPFKSLRVR